jgi:nitric oxide reductase NorD protein
MEEWVGGLWDRFITRTARRDYPEAAVALSEMEKVAGVFFRALGGDAGLQVTPATESEHGARRRWLSRLGGTDRKASHAARDGETLRLPPSIAWFSERELNRDLYLWLIALAAHAEDAPTEADWISSNQRATQATLARYPGLAARYARLLAAHLPERPQPDRLPASEAALEHAIRAGLAGDPVRNPSEIAHAAKPPHPVVLWLYPLPPPTKVSPRGTAQHPPTPPGDAPRQRDTQVKKRHAARREDAPENESPILLMFRAESLLSIAEYVKVNRSLDEDENPDAASAADNMNELAISADDGQRVASVVRFDLDLPASSVDDLPLGPGIPYPEWDHKKHLLRPDWCAVQMMWPRSAGASALPEHLRRPARKLKSQFAALQPVRRWLKGQTEGSEIDIDACLRLQADRLAGVRLTGAGLYLQQQPAERDLACLVLADLSLSTDAHISDDQRVIDVIRDSLLLFGEALSTTGDRFGMYGFSSLKRQEVRFHALKEFASPFDGGVRGRISALKPGYYTRMGAALRHATTLLAKQPQATRLLLLLSDGKPHDVDGYEGRHAIEDTRMALIEARRVGVRPFCVTIDHEGASYLPHLFGPAGFTVLRKPEELPARLPLLYAQLTGH